MINTFAPLCEHVHIKFIRVLSFVFNLNVFLVVSSELLILSLLQILSFFLLFWSFIDQRSQKCTFLKTFVFDCS